MRKKWLSLMLPPLILAGCATGAEEEKKEKELTVVLDWTPNTNHTGLYVASKKGYFAKKGLKVRIIQPGETGAEQLVASGRAQFGVSGQEALTNARASGVKIKAVAAIIQHNTSGFASPKNRDIRSPQDYEGKTYGGYGGPIEKSMIGALMKNDGGDVGQVDIKNIGSADYFTAVKKGIDFTWIYYGWTGVEAELRGEPLNIQYVKDYAKELDYYTPVLVSSESYLKQDPETAKAFLSAVSEGYTYAIDHPEDAAKILSKAEPTLDARLVEKSQEYLAKEYKADAPRWGEMKTSVYKSFGDWLVKEKLLKTPVDPESMYTNDFLPKGAN